MARHSNNNDNKKNLCPSSKECGWSGLRTTSKIRRYATETVEFFLLLRKNFVWISGVFFCSKIGFGFNFGFGFGFGFVWDWNWNWFRFWFSVLELVSVMVLE
jgi:hypothetical protein